MTIKQKLVLLAMISLPVLSLGQRYIADSSNVYFYSEAPMENIEAFNEDGNSVIDISEGRVAFSIPITGFQFEKPLMQEHFNENYLESEKYPTATFQGRIVNWDKSSLKDSVSATGKFKIHGVERDVTVKGNMSLDPPVITAKFPIALDDYKIKIPKVVFYNIAEIVEVTIYFKYKPYEK